MQQMKSASQRKPTPAAVWSGTRNSAAGTDELHWSEMREVKYPGSRALQIHEISVFALQGIFKQLNWGSLHPQHLRVFGGIPLTCIQCAQVNIHKHRIVCRIKGSSFSDGWFSHRDHPLFGVCTSLTLLGTGADHKHWCYTKKSNYPGDNLDTDKAPAVF